MLVFFNYFLYLINNIMNRFLLINNKLFFDKNNVFTLNENMEIPNKNCILFIGNHSCSINDKNFINKYLKIIKEKNFNYIIILGKGDCMIDKNIDIPKNIKYIYANNINYNHPIIKFLPMGSDFRSIQSFSKANIENKNRNILCYCNFSLNTHNDRKKIYTIVKDNKDILIENMGTFLNYSIDRDTFFKKLSNSKFVICPRGNALDTFRFYDTIYAGAIPIVVKENFHNEHYFKDIPILFLNNIDEFKLLNNTFLNNKYNLLECQLKTYYNNLDFQKWIEGLKFN